MIAVILAAGYATRMYPLTKNYPKPLLLVHQKPIIQYMTDELSLNKNVQEIFIVTNNKFYKHFMAWHQTLKYTKPIHIINDLTNENESRLGALKDVTLVLNPSNLPEAALIMAADNLFTFELNDLIKAYNETNDNIVLSVFEENIDKLRKTGVANIKEGIITAFKEKPLKPKGHYAIPPFYLYKKSALEHLIKYVRGNNPSDAPGSFIDYLIKYEKVRAIPMNGQRYDVGDIDSYHEIRLSFKK